MKTIRNLILVIALSVSVAVADEGHTNGGNRCTTCTPPPCTENCGAGFAAQEPEVLAETGTEVQDEETSMIDYWTKVFFEMIG